MGETKAAPEHQVFVDDIVLSRYPRSNAARLAMRLVGKVATAVQLAILVFGDKDVMVCKLGSKECNALWVCNHELCRRRYELVTHLSLRDRVNSIRVDDLEASVLHWAGTYYEPRLGRCFVTNSASANPDVVIGVFATVYPTPYGLTSSSTGIGSESS